MSPEFQFTHPVRGATSAGKGLEVGDYVSIHAPRAGCDIDAPRLVASLPCFNSRTPCGVRPWTSPSLAGIQVVSIHAPRAGCDRSAKASISALECFNSRTPCGVRQKPHRNCTKVRCFNSRTPCGVRHSVAFHSALSSRFQFTHPVRGATSHPCSSHGRTNGFNSRTPCGVRLGQDQRSTERTGFQFTHPVRGAT